MIEQLESLLRKKEAKQQEMQMQLEDGNQEEEKAQVFTEQVIQSASKGKGPLDDKILRQQRNYQVPKGIYRIQGVQPKKDIVDKSMVRQMQTENLPFVVKKIKKAEDQEGNYYLFGTKCILVTAMDGGDILVVKEQKGHGEIDFISFMAQEKDDQWSKI